MKLGDFGIARVLQKTYEHAKTMVGTPYYLSPEIVEGQPYSFKSDIWSLGIILYELCALKPPFTADSMHFLALRIVRGGYDPIPSQYSQDMRKMISWLLQNNPNKRPSVHEILKSRMIQNRVKQFLSETMKKHEFAHTILHNKKFVNLNYDDTLKVVENEQPCPPNLMKQYMVQNGKDIALPPLKPT